MYGLFVQLKSFCLHFICNVNLPGTNRQKKNLNYAQVKNV